MQKKKNDIYIKATPSCTDLWSTVLLWKLTCVTLSDPNKLRTVDPFLEELWVNVKWKVINPSGDLVTFPGLNKLKIMDPFLE